MFCPKCGNEISEGNLFCQNCGNRIGGSAPVTGPAAAPTAPVLNPAEPVQAVPVQPAPVPPVQPQVYDIPATPVTPQASPAVNEPYRTPENNPEAIIGRKGKARPSAPSSAPGPQASVNAGAAEAPKKKNILPIAIGAAALIAVVFFVFSLLGGGGSGSALLQRNWKFFYYFDISGGELDADTFVSYAGSTPEFRVDSKNNYTLSFAGSTISGTYRKSNSTIEGCEETYDFKVSDGGSFIGGVEQDGGLYYLFLILGEDENQFELDFQEAR